MLRTNLHNPIDFNGQKFYVGLDVHKKSWAVTIRSRGIQVAHFTQPPGAESLVQYLEKNFPGGQYYSAYEAGFCGTSIHEQLCQEGVVNIMIHAADIPATDKQKKNKTDLHDSRAIAEQLERGNLNGIYVLTRAQQELRSLFRQRQDHVQEMVRANNRLKSCMMFFGVSLPESIGKKEYLSLKALAWLNDYEMITAAGKITLQQYAEALRYQRKQLYQTTKLLQGQIKLVHAKSYECIISIPGVGVTTTMGIIAEVADFNRFKDPDDYCSFLGLCPWEDSSGDTVKTKGMQPRCNRHLRPLLIEASWTAIKKSPALFAYYSKHAAKNSKGAIVKVSRKVALTIRAVALSGKLYQADYARPQQKPAAKG